jgi:hypothetical protein
LKDLNKIKRVAMTFSATTPGYGAPYDPESEVNIHPDDKITLKFGVFGKLDIK